MSGLLPHNPGPPSGGAGTGVFDELTCSLLVVTSDAVIQQLVVNAASTFAGLGTFSNGLTVSSGAITFSGLTASTLVGLNGSKQATSVSYSTTPAASTVAEWDASSNMSANNFLANETSQAAGGTITLTKASSQRQLVSGTGATTIVLPDATTFAKIGATYDINNNTNATITVQDGSSSTLFTIPKGDFVTVYCNSIGSVAGTWDWHWLLPATAASGGVIMGNGSNAGYIVSTATYPSTTTANQLLYSSAANTVGGLTSANNGILVTNGSGVPSISTTLPADLTIPNFVLGQSSTGGGGTITLTKASNGRQIVTGAGATTIQMPDATTLTAGFFVKIIANGSGTLAVNDGSAAALIQNLITGQGLEIWCTGTGSIAGSWDWRFFLPPSAANGALIMGAGTGPSNGYTTVTPAASSVLISSVGSIPSWATTLPSGLTIPTPTFTGASTFPGSTSIDSSGNVKVGAAVNLVLNEVAASSAALATDGSHNVVAASTSGTGSTVLLQGSPSITTPTITTGLTFSVGNQTQLGKYYESSVTGNTSGMTVTSVTITCVRVGKQITLTCRSTVASTTGANAVLTYPSLPSNDFYPPGTVQATVPVRDNNVYGNYTLQVTGVGGVAVYANDDGAPWTGSIAGSNCHQFGWTISYTML